MNLDQLRCFVAAGEELHFGRAANRLSMLPATLGRQIRLLEEDLGTRLLMRTTRSVTLTEDGLILLDEGRRLLTEADRIASRIRMRERKPGLSLRLGAIDSAAAGLVPSLLHDFRQARPDVAVQLFEDKTIRLLPQLRSGRLDLAFVRPPDAADPDLEFLFLFHETAVVAVPAKHPLAARKSVTLSEIAGEPLIVPARRSRPHSHDLTIKLFAEAGLQARIAQLAEEKHTIVNLVAAELGIALVPRWMARMATHAVRYLTLEGTAPGSMNRLPLAAAWMRGSRDPVRDEMLDVLRAGLGTYASAA